MKNHDKDPARRPVEREYAAVMNAVVTLDKWRRICQRTADDAEAGDPKARDWLAKYLMQTEARTLTVMAAEESQCDSATAAEQEIADRLESLQIERRKAASDRQLANLTLPDCR
jgi:hypothetical protein